MIPYPLERQVIDALIAHPYSLWEERDRPWLETQYLKQLEAWLQQAERAAFLVQEKAKMRAYQQEQPC